MTPCRCSLRVLTWVVAVAVTGSVRGAPSADMERAPEPPARPDFSEMTPEQAAAAMDRFKQAVAEWERQDAPFRQRVVERDAAERAKRIRELQDPSRNPPPGPDAGPGYDWERDARNQGLDDETRARLRRDSLVIAGREYRQSFSIYDQPTAVPFVTSDSLLNGFHSLLESTLKRYERRRAAELREALEGTWLGIDRRLAEEKVTREKVEPFVRHLGRVIGPALRLLGSSVPLGDKALEADVDAIVRKINAADSVELPGWMAPAESAFLAIDFRLCRPLGFYTSSGLLADYYRAVRWLQLVPLRAGRDNEVGAAALAAEVAQPGPRGLRQFAERGEKIWGKEDGATICNSAQGWPDFLKQVARDGNAARAIEESRKRIVELAKWRKLEVNDRLRTPAGENPDPAVNLVAASVLPDARFFQAIAGNRAADRSWPQGLEIAGWLGSDFALDWLNRTSGSGLAEAIKEQRPNRDKWPHWNSTVPEYYYDVLRALFAPPDPAAPAFMSSEPWQRKSTQTALAGWAQLRHAWELQAKLNMFATCAFDRPTGLVEPDPLFFRRMSSLEAVLVARFQEAEVFADTADDEAEYLGEGLRLLERLGAGKVDLSLERERMMNQDMSDRESLIELGWIAHEADASIEDARGDELRGEAGLQYYRRVIAALRNRIERLRRREPVAPVDLFMRYRDPDERLFERWQSLQRLTGSLEAMAQKQLRGADWDQEESELLKNYGEQLKAIMGYFTNLAAGEKDDAPRWTAVFQDPTNDRNLGVAIGRARALYVLYPWKGKPVLCRGAVMTYYEFPSENRLTDTEWKELLDSPKAPAQPEWIQPLVLPAPPYRDEPPR